jgi:uncharacterized membrane protein YbhN (UPF0104 family)
MNKKVSNIIKYALSLAVAVVLLYFSFKGVKWSDFVKGLTNCRWEFIVVSMIGGVVAFLSARAPLEGTVAACGSIYQEVDYFQCYKYWLFG